MFSAYIFVFSSDRELWKSLFFPQALEWASSGMRMKVPRRATVPVVSLFPCADLLHDEGCDNGCVCCFSGVRCKKATHRYVTRQILGDGVPWLLVHDAVRGGCAEEGEWSGEIPKRLRDECNDLSSPLTIKSELFGH